MQAQLEILKQQAAQSMIDADFPSIVIPNYCQDTKPQHLQESQAIHHHHNNYQHQDGLFETEPNSDLKNIMTSYSELDQHFNTFNQYHYGSNDLLSASFGYISYS